MIGICKLENEAVQGMENLINPVSVPAEKQGKAWTPLLDISRQIARASVQLFQQLQKII